MSGLSQALGRNGIAYYAGRGVPLNVWKAKLSAMNSNKEFTDIMSILGMDPTKAPEEQQCAYEKIVQANDADCFEENTLVHTDKGLKPIKDVEYGDSVLSSDGTFREVKVINRKNTAATIRIKVNEEIVECTPTQKMLVVRDGKLAEVYAAYVKAGDRLLRRKAQ